MAKTRVLESETGIVKSSSYLKPSVALAAALASHVAVALGVAALLAGVLAVVLENADRDL